MVKSAGKKELLGDISRRRFLVGAGAAAAAAPWVVPASALGRDGAVAPSERVILASIGVGIRGSTHLSGLLPNNRAQIVAISDLFKSRRERAKKRVEDHYAQARGGSYKGCDLYPDHRKMLAREDIEGVVIATPEHWHALTMIDAVKAGKDVYGEKALTLTIAEGRAVVDSVRRFGRVFQVGTQQRSGGNFRHACELARNGYLGKLRTVKVGVPGGHALADSPPIPAPADLDYDRWLGPSPVKPYDAIRTTSPEGWYHITDYCAGWIESWGVHHVDIALWGAPALATGTLEVEGTAEFPTKGLGNTSTAWDVNCVTADGLRMHFTDNTKNPQGVRFEGDKGWVHVNRGGIRAEPASLLKTKIKPTEERLYESNHHYNNFLDCVRNRRDPVAPVEAGHAATTATLVADIATRLKRKVVWNWEKESFANDDAANRMRSRPMRSPWTI